MLEGLAHFTIVRTPQRLVLVTLEVPDTASLEEFIVSGLPKEWHDPSPPPVLAAMGDDWVETRRTLLLRVPSAVASGLDFNVLVNPAHPDFTTVRIAAISPFAHDKRVARL